MSPREYDETLVQMVRDLWKDVKQISENMAVLVDADLPKRVRDLEDTRTMGKGAFWLATIGGTGGIAAAISRLFEKKAGQ